MWGIEKLIKRSKEARKKSSLNEMLNEYVGKEKILIEENTLEDLKARNKDKVELNN